MKKILIIAAAAVVLALGVVAIASANGGPHGNYTDPATGGYDTQACGGCHRAHTAIGPLLLAASTSYDLCVACHDTGKATTDPFIGTIWNSTDRLNGGGFSMVNSAPATSMHQVEGVNTYANGWTATAFGGATSGAGISMVLECVTCHDPHGSTNYRILRDAQSNGNGGNQQVLAALPWANAQVIETNNVTNPLPGLMPYVSEYSAGDSAQYTAGMRDFCVTCHKTYLTKTGAYSHASTDAAYNFFPGTQSIVAPGVSAEYGADQPRYRHTTSRTYSVLAPGGFDTRTQTIAPYGKAFGIRLSAPYGDGTTTTRNGFVCTSCHFAHGTSAAADGWSSSAASVQVFATTGMANETAESNLLYYNNRGTCHRCHMQTR